MKHKIIWAGLAAITLALSTQARAQDSAPAEPTAPAVPPDRVEPAASVGPAAPMQSEQSEQAKPDSSKDVSSLIKSWPINTKVTAQHLIDKYGPPDASTDERLAWNDRGQWSQVRVFREGASDNFPTTHKDIVENTIMYDVPQDKAGELIKFDSALEVDRLSGTLSARSDSEEANILALNLADEIVRGKRDIDGSRDFMRSTLRKSMAGKSSKYTERLLFPVADRGPQK